MDDLNEMVCPRCGGEMQYVAAGIPDEDEVCESYFCADCSYHVTVYPDDFTLEQYEANNHGA